MVIKKQAVEQYAFKACEILDWCLYQNEEKCSKYLREYTFPFQEKST
jgi:hypothetical protein